MKAVIYVILGILSATGIQFSFKQKDKRKKIFYFILSSIMLLLSLYLFIIEINKIDFTKFINL